MAVKKSLDPKKDNICEELKYKPLETPNNYKPDMGITLVVVALTSFFILYDGFVWKNYFEHLAGLIILIISLFMLGRYSK